MVDEKLPKGTELSKIERKTAVITIHLGQPTAKYRAALGSATQIQLNDRFAKVADVRSFVINERNSMKQADQAVSKIALKADQHTKMGIMTDVKLELRKAGTLSLMYSAEERNAQ